jgi:hypothetical protein
MPTRLRRLTRQPVLPLDVLHCPNVQLCNRYDHLAMVLALASGSSSHGWGLVAGGAVVTGLCGLYLLVFQNPRVFRERETQGRLRLGDRFRHRSSWVVVPVFGLLGCVMILTGLAQVF